MNTKTPNTLSFRSGGAPDDLEGLLRDFFHSEMPEPWPTMKAPVSLRKTAAPASSRWAPVRSRLALAASVGLLMVGSWTLSSKLPNYNPGTADATTQSGSGKASRPDFKLGASKKITVERPEGPAK